MTNKGVTGIILAGGASRRMGKDKGLCTFNNKQLIEYSIETIRPLCDNILISTNNVAGYSKFGFPIIEDEYRNIGPIGGIYSGLKHSNTEKNLIVSCDTPLLITSLFKQILFLSEGYEIVVPQHNNSYYEPLAAFYSTTILSVLEESIIANDYKLINLYNKVKFKSVSVDDLPGFAMQFKNLNTPEDLL